MSMRKPLALAAVCAAMLAVAGPVLAKDMAARAFQCPATQAEAEALLSELRPLGAEVTDEYGTRTRGFDAGGRTVYRLPVYKLEVIMDADDRYDYVAFQAKTNRPFTAARDAMFAAVGSSTCENVNENTDKICKVNGPRAGGVSIMRYVEVSRTDGINVGCQYARRKG